MIERRSALRWDQRPRTIRTMQVGEELDALILAYMREHRLGSYSATIRHLVTRGLGASQRGHGGQG
jgi:hypothetical protein